MNIGALFRYVSRELKQTIHDDKDKENAKKNKRFNELYNGYACVLLSSSIS